MVSSVVHSRRPVLAESQMVPELRERLLRELPSNDHIGNPVLQVLVPVALSREELVSAFYISIDPGDTPSALTQSEAEESLLAAVIGRGVWEIQDEARTLVSTSRQDIDAARFLRGCEVLADRYLSRFAPGERRGSTD
ncbi:hypothetical protein SAMN05892883_0767 [Jatrophihabitans sp. GAS493]|uniref:hypothetical protein n=1 Tax=Jatrophihabitans sp. GAS493 TaxID=1907575 RepID=UPI000BC02AA3|nr:hypothetical protein [Jatrophihabitans sp. GAS493]SOD71203.1 hypothetical protein SAMN05892883_0767 [Jatrophihabitans sp. GAS493]